MNCKLGTVESRFADIVWENEPVTTAELVKLCADKLEWKRTTTYTVLKKLCGRGIFQLRDSIVSAVISRREYYALQSQQFVEEKFQGSLPAFIAAFTSKRKLTEDEIQEISEMIDSFKEVRGGGG